MSTPNTLRRLLRAGRKAGIHANGVDSREFITEVNPADFIRANAEIEADRAEIVSRAVPLNDNEPMFLEVNSDGMVVGHEGRHRMNWLAQQGYDSVPVRVRTDSYSEDPSASFRQGDDVVFQTQGGELRGRNVRLYSDPEAEDVALGVQQRDLSKEELQELEQKILEGGDLRDTAAPREEMTAQDEEDLLALLSEDFTFQ